MTERDLSREIMLTEMVSERSRQVIELNQKCIALEMERDSLLSRIREMEEQTGA